MGRTGLTNFVLWALTGAVLCYLLLERDAVSPVLGAAAMLLLAWRTPYRQEGLGAAAGVASVTLLSALAVPEPATRLGAALLIGGLAYAVWRRPLAA